MPEFINITEDNSIKDFSKLSDEIWHEYFSSLLSIEQIDYMVEKFQSYNSIKAQISEGYRYYFIVEEGINKGYCGFCKKDDALFLSKLYIKKEYRAKGLGRKAFEFIINVAIKENFKRITLTVNKYNYPTIKAYQNWGFKEIDSVVTDIGLGYVMDDYIMEKAIN